MRPLMGRDRREREANPDTGLSILGPGVRLVGDCETDGSIRIEGQIHGSVRAGKAVVIGRSGVVRGDVHTQDAVVAGVVQGSLTAESRLEVQATARIEGDVTARRLQLEEGAVLNGQVNMTESTKILNADSDAETAA